ncbi:MAG: CBS domain-containing protein [Bacteroidales bacterium]|jgi:acetoin utilization protein AcuB
MLKDIKMFAKDFIYTSFITVKTSTTLKEAKELMNEWKVSHLPIVNNDILLGILNEDDLIGISDENTQLGNVELSTPIVSVQSDSHIFDILQFMGQYKLSICPVTAHNMQYIGSIIGVDFLHCLSPFMSLNNPGGTIILEIKPVDYTMAQIASIIESNDAHILATFIHADAEKNQLYVFIKIDKMDIAPIIQTFNRYDYIVYASYQEEEFYEELYRNYEFLMRFLNI